MGTKILVFLFPNTWQLSYPRVTRFSMVKNTSLASWAVAFFLAVSVPLFYLNWLAGSGFIATTLPYENKHAMNSVIGFTQPFANLLIQLENRPSFDHVTLFAGKTDGLGFDFMIKRPLYGFLASFFVPLLGLMGAFCLINYLCWALCVWVSWRFARKIFDDETPAFVAVILTTLGTGLVFYCTDYEPHILSYALCYLGFLLLYETKIAFEKRPWPVHLGLGAFFGLASLAYNTGLMLVGSYGVLGFRKNGWKRILLGVFLGTISQSLWLGFLMFSGILQDYDRNESGLLQKSLMGWIRHLGFPHFDFFQVLFLRIYEFLWVESPFILAIGSIGIFLLRKNKKLMFFFVGIISIPLAMALIFAGDTALVRGYLIYQVSLVLYLGAAYWIGLGLKKSSETKILTICLTALLLLCQGAWVTAHLRGNAGPVKAFNYGMPDGQDFLFRSPVIMNYTGNQPKPLLFGGWGSWSEAGMGGGDQPELHRAQPFSMKRTFFLRALFFLYSALLVISLCRTRVQRVRGTFALLGVFVLTGVILNWGCPDPIRFFYPGNSIGVPSQSKLTYDIRFSGSFLEMLSRKTPEAKKLLFMVPGGFEGSQMNLSSGGTPIPLQRWNPPGLNAPGLFEAPLSSLSDILRGRGLTLNIQTDRWGAHASGWQRSGVPGRTLAINTQQFAKHDFEHLALYPIVEIRLLDGKDHLRMLGY